MGGGLGSMAGHFVAHQLLEVGEIDQGPHSGQFTKWSTLRVRRFQRYLRLLRITGLDSRGFSFLMGR